MKKSFLVVAMVTAIIVLGAVFACNTGDKKGADSTLSGEDSLKLKVERGRYLAHHVTICMDCHSERDFSKFSGPVKPGTEGMGGEIFDEGVGVPGVLVAPNITPAAIHDWTDEEIIGAFTGGRRKNGDTLFPMMPYINYAKLTKEDVYSIVAYIRSLKPIEHKTDPRKLFVPISVIMPQLPPVNLDENKMPDPADKINYGKYLVNAAACFDCHTPMNEKGYVFEKAFSGGYTFKLPGFQVTSANITPDSATGIGSWTEEAFLQKFKTNSSDAMVNTNPGKFNTIMPWTLYAKMKEDDLRAIYAYLRTVTPLVNKVEKWPVK